MNIVDVLLPQYGMGMQDAEIVQWLKGVGDIVKKGEVIAEIEAAKATMEVPAPLDGEIVELLVEPGVSVQVRTPIARIKVP